MCQLPSARRESKIEIVRYKIVHVVEREREKERKRERERERE
jgi:hypothetical protein